MSIIRAGVPDTHAIAEYSRRLREAHERVDLYHAAIERARSLGLDIPTVIAAVDLDIFPQEKEQS